MLKVLTTKQTLLCWVTSTASFNVVCVSSPAPTYLGQYRQLQRKSLPGYKATALDCRGQTVRGKQEHFWVVTKQWTAFEYHTGYPPDGVWSLYFGNWSRSLNSVPLPKGTLLCAETCPRRGTCLHRFTAAHEIHRRVVPHSEPESLDANLPGVQRGHWRGPIGRHVAHKAPPGSWAGGSGTTAMLKQVQWEWEAEAVSVSLQPCTAASPMSPSSLTLVRGAGIQ